MAIFFLGAMDSPHQLVERRTTLAFSSRGCRMISLMPALHLMSLKLNMDIH